MSESIYKGDLSIKHDEALLMGAVVAASNGIRKKLVDKIEGKFNTINRDHPEIGVILNILRDARNILAHDEIDNLDVAFPRLLGLCEVFVSKVDATWPNGWENCSASQPRLFGKKQYSRFEKATEILFHEIKKQYKITLREGIALDGFTPFGQRSLSDRLKHLIATEA
ncbi:MULTISPECIES: hypothetical protein [unclassified Burkholderia]|uniref:hypothetical protein n=1 Tax=unclassified Burkholderia TaxID=2613784 RepID=UPI000F5DAC42|nr:MULTISPECIES: hypothetical protein [unclassified Burkholderia]